MWCFQLWSVGLNAATKEPTFADATGGQLRIKTWIFSFFEAADLTIARALSHPTCY
jgi:hypothetical protein